MQVIYKLTQPKIDMYYEYTGEKVITPATSNAMNERMRAKMKERGYIMNKMGRRAYQIPSDTAFDCLSWCIEQSLKDICIALNREINNYIKPYKGNSIFSAKDWTFTVNVELPEDKKETYINGLKAIIEDACNVLKRTKLTVSATINDAQQIF